MNIIVINPNTSKIFNKNIENCINKFKAEITSFSVMSPASGPRFIEGVYDETLSINSTMKVILENIDQVDGILFACFSNFLGIHAAREITDKPVLGMAEASMHMSCMLGRKFSIVTTNQAWTSLLWDAVVYYGFDKRCASVRATGMPVISLEEHGNQTIYDLIRETSMKAINDDNAEVICLGSAGMVGLDKSLEDDLGVPVVDGLVAALKFVESLIIYGAKTSKRLTYGYPKRKALDMVEEVFYRGYGPE